MQYHALALAESGSAVDLIAYAGNPPVGAVSAHARIRLHLILPPLPAPDRLPRAAWAVVSMLRRGRQGLRLLWLLMFRIAKPDIILVQNPPALPTLLVGMIAARTRSARLIIDWHNFGYSMLALKLGPRHPAVRLARWYERILGRSAAAHLCVSKAMRAELAAHWGIVGAVVLYDRPAAQFAPVPASARESLLRRLRLALDLSFDGEPRPALIVSPTGWTEDEDYSMLLEAAALCDQLIASHERTPGQRTFTDLLIVITGRGPLRGHYEAKIRALALAKVHLRTLWLEPEDYPLLLGAADLGLCCHRSSCGTDLPMKIADLFGAGVPVLALDYGPCLRERLQEGENGLLFSDAAGLATSLYELFKGFPGLAPALERMRANLLSQSAMRWEEGWKAEAAALFVDNRVHG